MKDQLKNLLSEVLNRADLEPSERLRTKALGDDPAPIVVFDLGERGTFTLDLTRSRGAEFVDSGENENSNLRVVTDWDTLESIWTGRRDAVEAVRSGDLELDGSWRLAHGLQRYFDSSGGA